MTDSDRPGHAIQYSRQVDLFRKVRFCSEELVFGISILGSKISNMAASLFNRYIWLVDTIYRAGYISREEIDRRWARSQYNDLHEPGIPDRTFHRHKEAIREIFDIEIRCDRHRGNLYYIANTEDLEQDSMRQWLIGTFSVGTLLNESRDLHDRILFEEIPSGQQYLVPIVEAMREGRTLEIRYWSFRNAAAFDCELEPFCVKLFRQRWYLVARSVQTLKIRIFGLDRIQALEMTERHFRLPKDFDAREFFASCFGIIVDQQCSVETIRVRATCEQSNYLRTLPLHASQQEIECNNKNSVFEYRLRPTFDFLQELRKYADAVEVLEPQWLRERILTDALSVCRLYGAADGTAASGVTADGESVGMHDRYSEGGRL